MKRAARLRSQDWTAAVIKPPIVVVGILIALQVSNWNENRLDHARADGYCRRLHACPSRKFRGSPFRDPALNRLHNQALPRTRLHARD